MATRARTRKARQRQPFWTNEQWAILSPLSEAERTGLIVRATFTGLGLIGQAKREGFIHDDEGGDLRRVAPTSLSTNGGDDPRGRQEINDAAPLSVSRPRRQHR